MELKIKCINTTTSSDGSQYGKFVVEPLEKGFGTTVGNALRRVLLSSLEGAAATSIRIEGITRIHINPRYCRRCYRHYVELKRFNS